MIFVVTSKVLKEAYQMYSSGEYIRMASVEPPGCEQRVRLYKHISIKN